MAVDVYQPFTNHITGETFRCLSASAEAYVTEWVVQPGGFVPFEHVHLAQDEIFHVKHGRLRARLDGREFVLGAGQSINMPRGSRQVARNDGPGVLECVLEYRPGLDSIVMFQCFGGLVHDGDVNRQGVPNPVKMMYFMRRAGARAIARPVYLPGPFFRLALHVCFAIGSLAGWDRLYGRYTG
jgi:mannose-6-phosphate isomerase-like protein (cupin superfamily)